MSSKCTIDCEESEELGNWHLYEDVCDYDAKDGDIHLDIETNKSKKGIVVTVNEKGLLTLRISKKVWNRFIAVGERTKTING